MEYGYQGELAPEPQPLQLMLYWQAQGQLPRDYTIFYHLFDAQGHPVAQLDTQPVQGRYPTSFWGANEIVADPVTLSLSATLVSPCCTLNLGLYTLPDVRRLSITDRDGHSLGNSIVIPIKVETVAG